VIPQAVVNGILYASNATGIEASSANVSTGCSGSPIVCAPLWTYAGGPPEGNQTINLPNANIAVAHGVVYASMSSGLDAFDATGQTNCSGTPKLCQPLWSVSGTFGMPTVANGTVYVTTSSALEAFDASGTTNCSGSPKVCAPIWISSATPFGGTIVTVSGGIAYIYDVSGTAEGVAAFDATGVKGCSGSPKVCAPLWFDETRYQPNIGSYPFVLGTMLYVSTLQGLTQPQANGDFEAFDAKGVTGCSGTPSLCSPIGAVPALSTSPSVGGDNAVFVPSNGVWFSAFAANGLSPLWRSSNFARPLAIGGSVLYATDGTDVYAYDAGGSGGCSGSPLVCAPLWSAPGANAIVANGTLYVSSAGTSGNGQIVAYGLS